MFKEGRENTGEDWAEKIAAEIARLIQVDAAQVELAEFSGRPGSASKSFVESGENLIHGNEILAGMILRYGHKKRLHQSDHTLANIIAAVQKLTGNEQIHNDVLCTLASYLVLDALICNTDRHHENWGFLVHFKQLRPGSVSLLKVAPSFDHASSLGRELLDDRRSKLLRSKNMETYVRKGHGGIYLRSSDGRGATRSISWNMEHANFRNISETLWSTFQKISLTS